MNSVRVIKKYPNRRLYDTDCSRYITLADVKDFVIAMADMAQKNFTRWKTLQDEVFRRFSGLSRDDDYPIARISGGQTKPG